MKYPGRNLSQHLKEHQRVVKKMDIFSNAMSEHVCLTGHKINWENPTILAHHPLLWQRIILESWHIHNKHPSIKKRRVHCPVLTCHSRLTLMCSSPLMQCVEESKTREFVLQLNINRTDFALLFPISIQIEDSRMTFETFGVNIYLLFGEITLI